MKYVFIVLIFGVGGDVAFNHARYTNGFLGSASALVKGSGDAISNSLFAW